MPNMTLGDMSLSFQNARQTSEIKTRLQTLAQELSTGKVADITSHLGGDTNRLSSIDTEIAVLDSYAIAGADLDRFLTQQSLVLNATNDVRQSLASEFISITTGATEYAIDDGAARGRSNFNTLVANINTSFGDRSLFAGTAMDGPTLASADIMVADIVATIGGATTEAAISAAIETWFDDPAGGYATVGYLGDTGAAPTRKIGANDTVELAGRADDPAIRDVLKGAAYAAVVDALSGTLNMAAKSALIQQSGLILNESASGLIRLTSDVGATAARVEEVNVGQAAQRTAFAIARNDLTVADPYETATALQDVQRQLEMQFTMTARLSGLSLVNYI